MKTNVHFPTDINLLWDAIRKVVTLTAQLCAANNITTWRQSAYPLRQIKKQVRKLQKLRHSTSSNPVKQQNKREEIIKAYEEYMAHAIRQIDQITRRVIKEEKIPHAEKVFLIFEPHT